MTYNIILSFKMSGLLRRLYPTFFTDNTTKYEDDTINLMAYNTNRQPIKPVPLKVNLTISPELIHSDDLNPIEGIYPSEIYINKDVYKNYPELVEMSKTEKISLDFYVKHVKNSIRKTGDYDNKKKLINPVEFRIKNTPIKFICRAAYKLANIDYILNIMEDNNNFADLCGGPGGFSEYLLYKYPHTSGLGMTLKSENPDLDWKVSNFRPEIQKNRLVITYGQNYISGPDDNVMNIGDGNILKLINIESFRDQMLKNNPDGVKLVVADGTGFDDEDAQDLDSVEIVQFRLFVAEAFLATQILKKGGNYVMKIFKTKYISTQTFLILLASLFEESYIFKPITSRLNNSERYFVGKGFKYSPSNKIYFDFFAKCLETPDIEKYSFFDPSIITQDIKTYIYETSLENLQRQFVFCHIYQLGYSFNWRNYISLKKLWTIIFRN